MDCVVEAEPELETFDVVDTGVPEFKGRAVAAAELETTPIPPVDVVMLTLSVGKEVDDSLMTEEIFDTLISLRN